MASEPPAHREPHREPRSSISTVDDDDDDEQHPDARSPAAFTRINSGVSVKQATADFAHLQRELSGLSRASRVNSHASSRRRAEPDPEKGLARNHGSPASENAESDEEPFDLEAVLRGNLDAERAAGIRPKHIGVCWDGLTVKGSASMTNYVKTFPDAVVDFFDYYTPIKKLLGFGKKPPEATLLRDFRGVCRPGEMVLVLGRPGSGCTTFLKTIANQRFGFTSVTGHVRYGPFDAAAFEKYRGEAVYNQEDDAHHATLTVEQTLGFALDTKIPGKRPAGMSKHEFKSQVISTLLKMFNIEHTRHTVVGDAFTRGVSGGERKRVSIAEMMVTNACVLAWDNSTRGLDASTALDFVRSLRVQTDLYRTATFVSLYQASENIFRLFDKVLVIDAGRQVFFGPADKARSYFEGLGFAPRPRQTTPDYVTGCTDEYEREYAAGFGPANAPHDAESLAAAFDASPLSEALGAEMEAYQGQLAAEAHKTEDFRVAVRESKRGSSKRSVYSVGFHLQVWALMKRQFLRKLQDRLTLALAWLRSIVIAIVVGTLFFKLGHTSGAAFSRGGVMFISLLFNAFQAFAELGTTMTGRAVVNKHKAYAFHRPSALWIAQIIVDQAFAASQIMVFSIIVYFMCGLVREAGAFFIFYLMILSGNIAMTLFFRILGCISPDFDYAVKFAVVIITFLITTSGYIIQYESEKVWLRWIYWVNVLGLIFSSLMENEFSRISLTCSGESLIPSGPGYDNIDNQVCTLPGSVAGTTAVSGSAYIQQAFSYKPGDLWRNWGIVVAIIIFFLIMNVVLGEVVNFGMAGNTARVYQKPSKERKALNAVLEQKRSDKREGKTDEMKAELKIRSESILTWEKLNYDVPTPAGQRRLLNDVYGYVRPGQLTALMGASGAGKTTLLDVLAARKNIGVITGSVLVDGAKPGLQFQRSTSYAEQLDMHDPTQTVREALRFSADLRQPFSTPREEKYAYVEEIIALLEMADLADCVIGVPEAGLTVEQRKRVTIGVELAARPELLLFLDEPTSGLDSQSAFNIVRFLRKLAAAGQAILCTIHQPNAALFENFDRLLLLQQGGRTVYFGDIGPDAAILRDYLRRHGAEAKDTDNVAEFMLEAIGAGSSPRVGPRDWADIWAESPELVRAKEEIRAMREDRLAATSGLAKAQNEKGAGEEQEQEQEREYASPASHQLRVVVRRMMVSYWRSPNYLFTRLFNHFVVALLTGLTYINLDESRSSLQYKVFVMFQVTVLPALIIGQAEVMYHIKRALFFREQSSKMYSPTTFAAAMSAAELPYSIVCAVVFFLPIYFIPGLQATPSRAGYQFFMVLITEFFSVSLGQALAALTPSLFVSSQFDPLIMITFALFCGVTITPTQMPGFWRAWLYQLDPFTRLIGGMITTALHQLPVICSPGELNAFTAPQGVSCGDYMAPFFEAGGAGYLVDNTTSRCEYCAYRVGDQFFEPLGFSFGYRWRDLGIFACFIVSNMAILFLASRYLNFNRR